MSMASGCSSLRGDECSMHAQQTARGGVASSRSLHSASQWSSVQRSAQCLGRQAPEARRRGRLQLCASGARLAATRARPRSLVTGPASSLQAPSTAAVTARISAPPPLPHTGPPLSRCHHPRDAGADWGDVHRASPLWMPEPTIVSPDAAMVTAYGGAGATVSTGCVHLSSDPAAGRPLCTAAVCVLSQYLCSTRRAGRVAQPCFLGCLRSVACINKRKTLRHAQ